MTQLVVAFDTVCALPGADPVAAVKLAELAGADAVRVGAAESLNAVRESDVHDLRRAARCLELKIAPSAAGLKLAQEVRPDRVVLASENPGGIPAFGVLDVATEAGLPSALRVLGEAGIAVIAAIAPDVDAVKAAHGAGFAGLELFTGHVVDLPEASRSQVLERLGDAAKLAVKLRIPTSLGGGLDERNASAFIERAPGLERVAVGRSVVARALLVGMDRAVRDLCARLP